MVEVGERYRHFKGGEYEVLAVAQNRDNTDQVVVAYRALYGDGKTWVRLLDEFEGYKEIGGERIKRFELVRSPSASNRHDPAGPDDSGEPDKMVGIPVKVKKLKAHAVVPSYAHEGDAAMDLCSCEDYVVLAGKRQLVSTGIAMEIPEGYWANIRGKSGLAYKKGISLLGGVVEHGYRGEYGVVFLNTGDEDFVIRAGDQIAQVVIAPVATVKIEVVEELNDSVRGERGFGSGGSNV